MMSYTKTNVFIEKLEHSFWIQKMEQALSKPIERYGPQPLFDILKETLEAKDPAVSQETLDAMAILLADHLSKNSKEELISYHYLGQGCLVLGAFVENGADPEGVVDYFVPLITALVPQIFNTREKFKVELQETPAETRKKELEERLARDVEGALKPIELATAAILSRSKRARLLVQKEEEFLATCTLLRWDYPFLYKITHVLEDEELIILEVSGKWGMRVRISGISGNYQLLALLSHHVGQWKSELHEPLPQEWVDCYLGLGPIDRPGIMEFRWQPRLWTALCEEDNYFIEPEHYILGGGSPADIMKCPVLEGKRVVLWTPPDGPFAIHVGRDFEALRASFEILEILPQEIVEAYRRLIIDVSDDQRQQALQLYEEATNQGAF